MNHPFDGEKEIKRLNKKQTRERNKTETIEWKEEHKIL